jgi:hypothetical protein
MTGPSGCTLNFLYECCPPISVYCYYTDKTMYTVLLHMPTNVLNFLLPAPHRRLSGDCFDITLSSLTSTAYCPTLLRQVICNNRTVNHESHELCEQIFGIQISRRGKQQQYELLTSHHTYNNNMNYLHLTIHTTTI